MSSVTSFIDAWRYSGRKGRFIIAFGLIALLTIISGGIIMMFGLLITFTIVGVPNPDTDFLLLLFLAGMFLIIAGVVLLIIYLIGMSIVPPPLIPLEKTREFIVEQRKVEEERKIEIKLADVTSLRAELEKTSVETDLQDSKNRERYEWFKKQCEEFDSENLRIELFHTYLKMYKKYLDKAKKA